MAKDVYELEDLRKWAQGEEPAPMRLAVFGDPVAHSASPQMHNPALKTAEINSEYGRLHIREEELQEALRLLPEAGFIGTNLTIPHKQAALAVMDDVDDYARRIGAVNTVLIEGGKLIGFNTDGPGLVRAIRHEFGVDLRDMRVMLLGAGGGAGRAIAVQCALEGCERLVLVNRTFEKAESLAGELQPYFKRQQLLGPFARLEAAPWDEAVLAQQLHGIDLVINASAAGMKRSDPPALSRAILQPHLMVYDTIYTSRKTKLLVEAEEAGARGANGLSMLLYQGAHAFEIWFNRDAPLEVMRQGLLTHAAAQ